MRNVLTPFALLAGAAGVLASAEPAEAARFDLQLAEFATLEDGALEVDSAGFEAMSRDLGLALRPRFAGPGSTLGSLGFDFAYGYVLTDIDETSDHWTRPVASPAGTLAVSQLIVRKGLPYSFEIGGVLSHLHDSRMWAIALELKWAFVEGFRAAPDIGLRNHINTLVGSRDLAMLTVGSDLLLSKQFGLGGMVQLTPFLGYGFTFIRASSHVLGRFPEGGLQPATFIMPDQNILAHRGVLGLRVLASVVDVGVEAALGKDVMSFGFRTGVSF